MLKMETENIFLLVEIKYMREDGRMEKGMAKEPTAN
jgi:hypothetical protein